LQAHPHLDRFFVRHYLGSPCPTTSVNSIPAEAMKKVLHRRRRTRTEPCPARLEAQRGSR
ncbi:MAG: hypothetical protein WC048_06705, partial [Rhizobium sp.]